jgi:pimeloyl-ACP methyl ester carboxylesterase
MSVLPALVSGSLVGLARVSPRLAGWLAFGLFRYPGPRAQVRPVDREIHHQAQVTELRDAGRTVAVYQWGDGSRPVLMLHGWGGRGSRFAALVPALRGYGFSPVTLDAPGHGASTGRSTHILDYAAIAHRLQERHGPFEAVVGHSFGALTAFHAVRTGLRTRRLVSIASPCEFGYLPRAFAAGLGLSDGIEADLRRRTERLFAPQVDIWQRLSASHQPSGVDMPLLVVHDTDDRVVLPAQARLLAGTFIPPARMVLTSGFGHHRILSAPAVVRDVSRFIADGTPPGEHVSVAGSGY